MMSQSCVFRFLTAAAIAVPVAWFGAGALAGSLNSVSLTDTLNIPNKNDLKNRRIQQVDLHLVLAIDNSDSITDEEFVLMMKGYRDGFLSQETKDLLSDGATRAISVIFYGDSSYHAYTGTLDKRNVLTFVDKIFWDMSKNESRGRPRAATGFGTSIQSAQKMIGRLLENEQAFGFKSMARRVIISGDEVPFPNLVASETKILAQKFGVVVFGAPIISDLSSQSTPATVQSIFHFPSLSERFRDFVVTPKGLSSRVFGFSLKVPPGTSIPVEGFSDVKKVMPQALALNLF